MSRLAPITALLLAAMTAPAFADADAPPPKAAPRTHVARYTTPPGYRSPEQIERDRYNSWRRDRAFAIRHGLPRVSYYYYGSPTYNGRFGANRYDSLHAGPCWTQTPIGAMWNCGR